jgi:3-dehydroquinate synthase
MKRSSTTFTRSDTIDFLFDNDKKMDWIGKFKSAKYNRIFLVIDENVDQIWGKKIAKQLAKQNKDIFTFKVKPTEASKSITYYPKFISFLESHNANLKDLVIAVGGGIVIDLVSFSCSTYMRGLPFYVIATTLIGMIDASTAGKTCLSTKNSKNILGTFYYPLVVYSNIHFLDTYSWYYHRQGLSEIFKYGLLGSQALLDAQARYLKAKTAANLNKMIALGSDTRIAIRNIHPQASNLGHTFGHALEKMSGYKILHGDGFIPGTIIALHFGLQEGITTQATINKITQMIKDRGLNIYIDSNLDVDEWIKIMMTDKKSDSKYINLVLLKDVEQPYTAKTPFYSVTPKKLRKFLKSFLKSYPHQLDNCAKEIHTNNLEYKNDN